MKMQGTIATQWSAKLPPILARVFAGRAEKGPPPELVEPDEVEIPQGRWALEEGNEAGAGKRTGRIARRPEIMVPVDFTASSEEAVEYAIKVAQRSRARLILLHAVYLNLTPYGPANPAWLRFALCREAFQKMEEIMALAHQRGVPTISVIEEGEPARVVANAAKRWNVDLLVMASRKRGRWARFFGPKILEKVTNVVECPVMVIRTDLKGAVV